MKKWRQTHRLSGEQRFRKNVRNTTQQHVRRGHIKKLPCQWAMGDGTICGRKKVQAHHQDYSKPLEVDWWCKEHHHLHHAEEREKAAPG